MKCETSLNASGLNTDNMLIDMCWRRKKSRKNPERAIANFLTIELDIRSNFIVETNLG